VIHTNRIHLFPLPLLQVGAVTNKLLHHTAIMPSDRFAGVIEKIQRIPNRFKDRNSKDQYIAYGVRSSNTEEE